MILPPPRHSPATPGCEDLLDHPPPRHSPATPGGEDLLDHAVLPATPTLAPGVRTYLIMPSLVPITLTRSESQLSLRGVGEKRPYIIDGFVMKSVQKQTVSGFSSSSLSCDFFIRSRARDSIAGAGAARGPGRPGADAGRGGEGRLGQSARRPASHDDFALSVVPPTAYSTRLCLQPLPRTLLVMPVFPPCRPLLRSHPAVRYCYVFIARCVRRLRDLFLEVQCRRPLQPAARGAAAGVAGRVRGSQGGCDGGGAAAGVAAPTTAVSARRPASFWELLGRRAPLYKYPHLLPPRRHPPGPRPHRHPRRVITRSCSL